MDKIDYFDLIYRKLKDYYSYFHYLYVGIIWLLLNLVINIKKV